MSDHFDELETRALALGEKLYLKGEVSRREALAMPLLANAVAAYVDLGVLARSGKDLERRPGNEAEAALERARAELGGYLAR